MNSAIELVHWQGVGENITIPLSESIDNFKKIYIQLFIGSGTFRQHNVFTPQELRLLNLKNFCIYNNTGNITIMFTDDYANVYVRESINHVAPQYNAVSIFGVK